MRGARLVLFQCASGARVVLADSVGGTGISSAGTQSGRTQPTAKSLDFRLSKCAAMTSRCTSIETAFAARDAARMESQPTGVRGRMGNPAG